MINIKVFIGNLIGYGIAVSLFSLVLTLITLGFIYFITYFINIKTIDTLLFFSVIFCSYYIVLFVFNIKIFKKVHEDIIGEKK